MIRKLILFITAISSLTCSYEKTKSLSIPKTQYLKCARQALDPKTIITVKLLHDIKQSMQDDTMHELNKYIKAYWSGKQSTHAGAEAILFKKLLTPGFDNIAGKIHPDITEKWHILSGLAYIDQYRLHFYQAATSAKLCQYAMVKTIEKLKYWSKQRCCWCAIKNGYSPIKMLDLYKLSIEINTLKEECTKKGIDPKTNEILQAKRLELKEFVVSTWFQDIFYDKSKLNFVQKDGSILFKSNFEQLRTTLIDVIKDSLNRNQG